MEPITLNKNNPKHTIKINAEKPFFKLTNLKAYKSNTEIQLTDASIRDELLIYNLKHYNNKIEQHQIHLASYRVESYTIENNDVKTVELELTNNAQEDLELHVYYSNLFHVVDTNSPFEEFHDHIKINKNVKILFSAPFGQGKTSFLNEFFKHSQAKHEVFKLYPVNYAVSHNEDIFKYIKVQLLFQLLQKDVEFEKVEFDYSETAWAYLKAKPLKIIAPLIALIPKVGESVSKVYEKIFKVATDYLDYHDSTQINTKKNAIAFIKEVIETEGSIFEDDFYTQLIRGLLEQHKEKHNKQNVLIIDDIDRMDPDHIFRIFNVFSANFDSYDDTNGYSDKFGFDKIVLVCDYDNIKKIFAHRYGSAVSFEGYLSKYYSTNPYYYDNDAAILKFASQIVKINGKQIDSYFTDFLLIIIAELVYQKELSLREMLKLMENDFFITHQKLERIYSNPVQSHLGEHIYFPTFEYLKPIFDLETQLDKFMRCKSNAKIRSIAYSTFAKLGLPSLRSETHDEQRKYSAVVNNVTIKFNISSEHEFSSRMSYANPTNVEKINSDDTFDKNVFYDILILNIKKYIEISAKSK